MPLRRLARSIKSKFRKLLGGIMVLVLGELADLKALTFNNLLMLIRILIIQFSTFDLNISNNHVVCRFFVASLNC
jgi:hypothetical protein